MPTHPRLCNKVNTQSDSLSPTVLKEDVPFPTSTALDDLELLQPRNYFGIELIPPKLNVQTRVAKRTNQLYISVEEQSFVIKG